MIYLDNGATSFPKPKGMIMEIEDCISNYCGNPGRSGHNMSIITGEKIYEARRDIAEFFNIKKPERLIFTKNTTESLNAAMMGFLKKDDHVITTSMEHNSVLRPLKELEKSGITHTIVGANKLGKVNPEDIKSAINENTKLIVMTGASNVTGTKLPIHQVGEIARENNIGFLLDAAQCAGNMAIDVERENISMLAFPGHKGLLGPQGVGGLFVSEDIPFRPLLYGGTGTESKSNIQPTDFPESYEAGTINSPGIIGLGYSIKFIQKIGLASIGFLEEELIKYFDDAIDNMENLCRYGPNSEEKVGISLFNIKGMGCEEVTDSLNRYYNIAVRGSYHCAGLAHKTIGTFNMGAIRLSPGPFTTRRDMSKAIDALWEISKNSSS